MIWDTSSGAVTGGLPNEFSFPLAFSRQGRIASKKRGWASKEDTILLMDQPADEHGAHPRNARVFELKDTGEVTALDFSPDGRLLAWGNQDATVKVWEVPQELAF